MAQIELIGITRRCDSDKIDKKTGKKVAPAKCGKHAVLRRYPFYLAFENSNEDDYVSEKIFHALEAGVLPIYLGAANVEEFVPPHSVVRAAAFSGAEELAEHMQQLLREPERYLEYFRWKKQKLPASFQRKFGFVATHAKCRLCRWAYSHKYHFQWLQREQRPALDVPRTLHPDTR